LNPGDKSAGVLGPADILERTGVRPDQVVDWLSLVGDPVDNIPGVPGVGEKTAAVLLQKFGNCERIFERIDEIEPLRLRGVLREAAELVRRNRRMIRLNDDVELGLELSELRLGDRNTAVLRELYTRWGFKSLLAELRKERPGAQGVLFN
ncbi:MAG: DNA polymerase I, partial [Verrucomicrobiae bacterium]|nr:DNA polymerase I [Verrucomicrobiae bacterium]